MSSRPCTHKHRAIDDLSPCQWPSMPYNARVKVIAVINQKGGVGKTTSVANLGAAIAASGHNVCLIDLDPQSHLTLHYGIEPDKSTKSVYDLLTSSTSLAEATLQAGEHLWVIPSTIDLAAAEVELVSTVGREQILRDHLRGNPLPYEMVMIDCPPSLGLLTLNALAAADEVIIPLQPHFLALQGLGKLLETVSLVQRRINPGLRVGGVIMCMYESNTKLSGEVLADLTSFFDGSRNSNVPWQHARIFTNVIRRNIKLAECPSYGRTIFDYEPNSRGAEDYRALAEEFVEVILGKGTDAPVVAAAAMDAPAVPDVVPVAQAESSPAGPAAEAVQDQPPQPSGAYNAQQEPPMAASGEASGQGTTGQ